jgi:hypothetical protein
MATIATKSKPVVKIRETHAAGVLAPRLEEVADRTAQLSDELLTSFEKNERAAIEAIGRFVITIEEALPEEVAGTTEVAKKVTESGLEMTDRLVHTGYHLLREVIGTGAGSLSRRDGTKAVAA